MRLLKTDATIFENLVGNLINSPLEENTGELATGDTLQVAG